MPRTKQAARRGKSHRGGSRGGRGGSGLDTKFVPFAGTSSHEEDRNGFTLQEEARNTERHQSFWDSDQRLRYSKMNFISPTSTQKAEANETESALADMSLDSPPVDVKMEVNVEAYTEEGSEDAKSKMAAKISTHQGGSITPYSSFIIDTRGGGFINTGLPPPRLRSSSPTPSDSSEEVILFGGRKNLSKGAPGKTKCTTTSNDPIDAKIRVVEERIHEQEELLEEVLHHEEPTSNLGPVSAELSSEEFEAILSKNGGRNHRRGRRGHVGNTASEDEAIIADYLANIDAEGLELPGKFSFNQRDLGGTEDELWQDETEMSSGEPPPVSKEDLQGGWDPSTIEDLDDLSTSDGVMGEVQAIFSKRERKNGLQYLVVWEDQIIDDARWVPATTLTSVIAQLHIEKFETEEKLAAQFAQMSDEDDDGSIDSDDMDAEDNKDILQRRIEMMDDEQIARLLAKQEELGMGSNEVLLFDDTADADADEDEGFTVSNSKFSPLVRASWKKPGAKRPRGDFPPATALADAYNGFDVMDFDRPSLKKKPKGRKGKLILDDVSDSELEESMQAAWDNDRIKKKERKQEREELRAQGLLGKKNGKADLKQKYKEGMGISAIKEEIKIFLMGSNTTLALPPMDKADRKLVHEIANAFNLKSKSAGTDKNRFPVLYRTSRTSTYVERTFAAVDAKLTRRFLPRMDVNGKRSGTTKRSARGAGGFNNAAVSYRDGDIVGGSAPELGVENKGRAMLEKMGWSSGTALGALNNKGILQPVSHVVKTTKAGLG